MIAQDALALDEGALWLPGVRIAANLPYNVGTAILIKWLTAETWPPVWQSLTLMFQREVAERLVARPGGEHYGRCRYWRSGAARSKSCSM